MCLRLLPATAGSQVSGKWPLLKRPTDTSCHAMRDSLRVFELATPDRTWAIQSPSPDSKERIANEVSPASKPLRQQNIVPLVLAQCRRPKASAEVVFQAGIYLQHFSSSFQHLQVKLEAHLTPVCTHLQSKNSLRSLSAGAQGCPLKSVCGSAATLLASLRAGGLGSLVEVIAISC